MSTEHIETVIIGAGQAGLSTAYHLTKQGRACVVLDSNARIGDNWRRHWDTLRLYSPAKYDGLPGMPFPADPWTFPQKDEVAAFLESYALEFDLPVRMSTRVDALEQRTDGGFEIRIGENTITCDNVVVATGTFGQAPNIPDFGHQLDPTIRQLHSSQYHRPDDLQPDRSWWWEPPTPARTSPTKPRRPTGSPCAGGTPASCRSGQSNVGRSSFSRWSSSRGGTSSPAALRWDARSSTRCGRTGDR